MKGFEEVIKKFPRCAEGYALYAQVNVIFHTFLVASPLKKKKKKICTCVLNPSREIRKQCFVSYVILWGQPPGWSPSPSRGAPMLLNLKTMTLHS